MKKEFPVDTPERSMQIAIEQAKGFLPSLRSLHDHFEDRSIMANKEVADFLAQNFTVAGVEVFSDFAKSLKEAKMRQTEKEQ